MTRFDTGSAYSAVVDAARIARRSVPVDVALADGGTVSLAVALYVASACDAHDRSGDPKQWRRRHPGDRHSCRPHLHRRRT
jgi:hypothetical protein